MSTDSTEPKLTLANFPAATVDPAESANAWLNASIAADAERAKACSANYRSPLKAFANCQLEPWLTFYFDGTGNNMDIDLPSKEHSNVARLFIARAEDSPQAVRRSYYVPGIGTPFREIGDAGGAWDQAVGGKGQKRLDWAWEQLAKRIDEAVGRATNPVNKIRMIHVAVFGFSRGAAAARAFAVKLAQACVRDGAGWKLKDGEHPIRLYFMGLFDTVGSVGVPAAARKYQAEASVAPLVLGPVLGSIPILITASADGHAAWASDLRIPDMAERCVHFVAGHEIRNSFPLDTALNDGSYPHNCKEVVYPGVHSNVGGGYRPGEGGRTDNPFAMLSLIPLKAMYDEARKAGVPLVNVAAAPPLVRDSFFSNNAENQKAREVLSARFNHYMSAVGRGGKPVGEMVRAHMKMYFRWRIVDIGRKLGKHGDIAAQRLAHTEAAWAKEKADKTKQLEQMERDQRIARQRATSAATVAGYLASGPMKEEALREAELNRAKAESLQDPITMQKASIATMPGSDGSLVKSMAAYDEQFLEDSEKVLTTPKEQLGRFARVLREAWDEPPPDAEIIAFFDDYVVDSLAGFAMDRTRATEYRILYQGGDQRVSYAKANAATSKEPAAIGAA